ncbi:hypothetical protein HL658_31140 [Azospirillum sp. RWY-5-1]|uniref:Phage holin family protein n=1 Tax=Azospirillum oleiclasticum TaxID=2735135 RepID=A0ABX2TJL0_9PROT|nr:hypothetical protein [Azospirillum oleiclasticum]NYZ17020.1 hypothetical protein [Azospirillum oleiclasticum]NYZ24536.1 hypothetical protein [Azospirillum oleiclasticum]
MNWTSQLRAMTPEEIAEKRREAELNARRNVKEPGGALVGILVFFGVLGLLGTVTAVLSQNLILFLAALNGALLAFFMATVLTRLGDIVSELRHLRADLEEARPDPPGG